MAKSLKRRHGIEDKVVDGVVYFFMALVFVVTLYPFYYCFILSLNLGSDAVRGQIYLLPRVWTLDNYRHVLSNPDFFNGFVITVLRTFVGTVLSVFFTGLFAYGLSHRHLKFRKFYMGLLIVSMYFSGGLVPYFILLRNLGLYNSFLVYIIPGLLGGFNAIIMMSFFREIPESIEESVRIDGANDLVIFFRIILPISTPVFATIALFNGVGHWNNWFDTAYYTRDKSLRTLSFMLIEIIQRAQLSSMTGGEDMGYAGRMQSYTAETIRMATMMIVVIPIICVYPFLQKYFVKGAMIGSIKE